MAGWSLICYVCLSFLNVGSCTLAEVPAAKCKSGQYFVSFLHTDSHLVGYVVCSLLPPCLSLLESLSVFFYRYIGA